MPKKQSDKQHYLHLHIGDWRKDAGVRLLSWEEKGIYIELLLLLHECDPRGMAMINGRAMTLTEVVVAISQGVNPMVKAGVARIIDLNVLSIDENTGAIYSRRMIRDERNRLTAKENGRKGGNPILFREGVNPRDIPMVKLQLTNIEEKEEANASSKKKSRGRPKGTSSRLSPDWLPPVDVVDALRPECPDVDMTIETKKFVDYWIAVSGQRGVKTDWPATFRNWIRTAQERIVERRSNGRFQTTADKKDRAFESRTALFGDQPRALQGDRADHRALPPAD